VLKAHAAAVKTYRAWYQPTQQGKIGFTTNVVFGVPLTNAFEGIVKWQGLMAAACDMMDVVFESQANTPVRAPTLPSMQSDHNSWIGRMWLQVMRK